MERKSVTDIVKTESTRQTVILLFSVVGAVASVAAVRHFSDPVLSKYYKMLFALKLKRFADRQADFWDGIAGRAAQLYNTEKL